MALFLAVSILWALIWYVFFVAPVSFWLILIVHRLLYRAWQVCQTPNEVLVEKLGLDIPPPPEVTLEEITAREIRLAWKQPDFHNSIHKHIIQVNNVKGTSAPIPRFPFNRQVLKFVSGRIKTSRNRGGNFEPHPRKHIPYLRSFC